MPTPRSRFVSSTAAREVDDRLRHLGLGLDEHDRLALVRERGEARVERDPREERRLDLRGERLAAARAEELLARPDR